MSCWEWFFQQMSIDKGLIEFDLDKDGDIDTSYYEGYIVNPGPNKDFAEDSKAQMNLTNKLSVETGYLDLSNFVDRWLS